MTYFFRKDITLEEQGQQLLARLAQQFAKLIPDDFALTWIVYDNPIPVNTGGALSYSEFWKYQIRGYHYRGKELTYPSDLVQIFYLVAVHEWIEKGMIHDTPELIRAMQDMMRLGSYDATSYIIDLLTGTNSGVELPTGPLETFVFQRQIINRYYQTLNWHELNQINLIQKLWDHSPYGRERQLMGAMMENNNRLTTNAVAKLFHAIMGGIAVSSDRSLQMMAELTQTQIATYYPPNTKIWSKARDNPNFSYDASYIEIPDTNPYLLVIFSESPIKIIPFISEQIMLIMKQISAETN